MIKASVKALSIAVSLGASARAMNFVGLVQIHSGLISGQIEYVFTTVSCSFLYMCVIFL